MKGKYLLGFDAGTSGSKGTITDIEGRVIATAERTHTLISPAPGFAEHDPMIHWEQEFIGITSELLSKAGASSDELAGIGISTVMAGIVFCDENYNPLRNAILYGIDTRCVAQAEELTEKIGKETMLERFGTVHTVDHYGPKILWVRENEPEIFEKTKHITIESGFLTARLTGNNMVSKYSASAGIPMVDPKTGDWSDDFCGLVCDRALLPEIAPSADTLCGTVTAKAAKEFGLTEGTPVVVGATDAGAEAVSVGVVKPGDMMLMYGSTAFMIALTDFAKNGRRLDEIPYVLKGVNAKTAGMATTGSLTGWIRNVMAKDLLNREEAGEANAYQLLFKEAEGIPVGSDGIVVLPYFQGERMPILDPAAKGVLFGLGLQHTRGHIVHAAFEGIGYGIDQNLALFKESGFDPGTVTAVGGGTKTRLWLQTVSDICGISQKVPEVTVGASYGDALFAGLAVGAIASPDDINNIVKIKYTTEPDAANFEKYREYKEIYRELYERSKDLMHRL